MKSLFVMMAALMIQPAFALMFKDGKVILENLSEYPSCQGKDYSGEWCHAALQDWVKAHPSDAFEAGVMTRKIMIGHNAVPFFYEARDSKSFDCKNEQLKLAVMSGLGQPSDYPVVKLSQELFTKCKADLEAAVSDESSKDSYVFNNICSQLKLNGLRKKKCEALKK